MDVKFEKFGTPENFVKIYLKFGIKQKKKMGHTFRFYQH